MTPLASLAVVVLAVVAWLAWRLTAQRWREAVEAEPWGTPDHLHRPTVGRITVTTSGPATVGHITYGGGAGGHYRNGAI